VVRERWFAEALQPTNAGSPATRDGGWNSVTSARFRECGKCS
jgi:hypothetical protein